MAATSIRSIPLQISRADAQKMELKYANFSIRQLSVVDRKESLFSSKNLGEIITAANEHLFATRKLDEFRAATCARLTAESTPFALADKISRKWMETYQKSINTRFQMVCDRFQIEFNFSNATYEPEKNADWEALSCPRFIRNEAEALAQVHRLKEALEVARKMVQEEERKDEMKGPMPHIHVNVEDLFVEVDEEAKTPTGSFC